jgi:flagellar protein FlgJ
LARLLLYQHYKIKDANILAGDAVISHNTDAAYVYNDMSGLNDIKQQSKDNSPEALRAVAKQFESIFVKQMLKSMRDANDVLSEGNMFNDNKSKFYRQMFDDQIALNMVKGDGIGLAESLFQQMSQQFDIGAKKTTPIAIQDMPRLPMKHYYQKESNKGIAIDSSDIQAKVNDAPTSNHATTSNDAPTNNDATANNESTFSLANVTPQEFVQKLYPFAKQAAEKLNVSTDGLIAQAALETGWGQYILQNNKGESSHNLFNIKSGQQWQGRSVDIDAIEYQDGKAVQEKSHFRMYSDYAESFEDYATFLQTNPRYDDALKQTNPADYVRELQSAGYATDPAYAQKINNILNASHFKDGFNLASNEVKSK